MVRWWSVKFRMSCVSCRGLSTSRLQSFGEALRMTVQSTDADSASEARPHETGDTLRFCNTFEAAAIARKWSNVQSDPRLPVCPSPLKTGGRQVAGITPVRGKSTVHQIRPPDVVLPEICRPASCDTSALSRQSATRGVRPVRPAALKHES